MGSAFELLNSGNTHRVKQAEVEAKRELQKSGNEREAASASLARFSQSLSNKRRMDAAGAEYNARGQNIAAAVDQATAGTFYQRVKAAQELGSATVMAAAAGVGGSTIDTFRRTQNLQAAITEEGQQRAVSGNTVNATQSQSMIITDAVAGLSNNSIQANLDYTKYLDHVKQTNVFGAFLAAGVATYFGGPQAGMAVTDAIAGSNRAANGDNAGAAQLYSSALSNGIKGYQYNAASSQSRSSNSTQAFNSNMGAISRDVEIPTYGLSGSGLSSKSSSFGFSGNGFASYNIK